MPSRDKIDPEVNKWMGEQAPSAPARPSETEPKRSGREMSATVMRLARRLRSDPDELASKIPPDTLRRTKFPVIETVNEDGTRSFKHDLGIEERRRAEYRP